MHMWEMTHSYVWHDSCICETWLIHMCDMTHAYVRHDVFIYVTRVHSRVCHEVHEWHMTHMTIHQICDVCDMTHVMWHVLMWDMTHWYMWQLLIHMCVTSCIYLHMWHDSYICEIWLIHTCDITHAYVRHDVFIRATRAHLWVCHDVHVLMKEWRDSHDIRSHSYVFHTHSYAWH